MRWLVAGGHTEFVAGRLNFCVSGAQPSNIRPVAIFTNAAVMSVGEAREGEIGKDEFRNKGID